MRTHCKKKEKKKRKNTTVEFRELDCDGYVWARLVCWTVQTL